MRWYQRLACAVLAAALCAGTFTCHFNSDDDDDQHNSDQVQWRATGAG